MGRSADGGRVRRFARTVAVYGRLRPFDARYAVPKMSSSTVQYLSVFDYDHRGVLPSIRDGRPGEVGAEAI